jgi:hypothetical protein
MGICQFGLLKPCQGENNDARSATHFNMHTVMYYVIVIIGVAIFLAIVLGVFKLLAWIIEMVIAGVTWRKTRFCPRCGRQLPRSGDMNWKCDSCGAWGESL